MLLTRNSGRKYTAFISTDKYFLLLFRDFAIDRSVFKFHRLKI